MTKLSFSIKTLLVTIVMAFSLLIGGNVWAFAGLQRSSVFADTVTFSSKSQETVASYNFESDKGTNYPLSPSNFSKISDEASKIAPDASGVISLSSSNYTAYKSNYKLESYDQPSPISEDNANVLMINATTNSIYYGYQTNSSNTLTLKANSFYAISVAVYTHADANASIYIDGTDFEELQESQIININTNNSWKNYTFYIETSKTNSSSANIQLYLGAKTSASSYEPQTSSNFALFDNIIVNRLSGAEYASRLGQSDSSTISVISLDKSTEITSSQAGFITNGDFRNNLDGWTNEVNTATSTGTVKHISNLNQAEPINSQTVILGTHQPKVSNTNGVLISANNGGSIAISSSKITIKQLHTYRIAFWAKGNLNGSTLNLKVSGIVPDGTDEGLTCSGQYTSLETSAESINGEWSLYEFYVVGNPLSDTEVKLTLGITSANSTDSGYVAVADIRSYVITSQQMSDGTSNNSNAKTVKMYSTANTLAFDNYSFNLVNTTDSDVTKNTYPLTPTSWTAGNSNLNSGVVNISESEWDKQFQTRPSKSGLAGYSDESDNVLMLNGSSGKVQSFTSASQSLSASGYAKVTFQAYINSTSTAYVTIKNSSDTVIAQMAITNKNSTASWNEYAIYLHNYINAQDITATLSLGKINGNVAGYAYFDNVKFDSSVTQETFDEVSIDDVTAKFDLTTNSLNATAIDSIEPLMWTMNNNTQEAEVVGGIVNYKDASKNNFGSPQNPEDNPSEMVMVIQANEPAYATYNSNLTYSLDASSYYKLTVWVKTTNLAINEQDEDTTTNDGELIEPGASIIMTNVDSSFKKINTQNSDKVDEWKLYTMYIYTTDAITSTIQLGLGCENMATKGTVYFANLNLTALTEDDYKNDTIEYADNLPDNVLLATNVPEDDDEDNSAQAGKFDPFAFSTIIIAVAVIFAVIGMTIKKVKQNAPKRSNKVSNNYDRLQTLMKDVDRRERKTAINHKLKLLKEELEQSQTFLAQEINDLRKQTESYNTAKEIAQDNPSIELNAPDVRQIQKEIQMQTAKIKQIEEDIAILEDEKDRIEAITKKSIEKRNASKNKKSK